MNYINVNTGCELKLIQVDEYTVTGVFTDTKDVPEIVMTTSDFLKSYVEKEEFQNNRDRFLSEFNQKMNSFKCTCKSLYHVENALEIFRQTGDMELLPLAASYIRGVYESNDQEVGGVRAL